MFLINVLGVFNSYFAKLCVFVSIFGWIARFFGIILRFNMFVGISFLNNCA